MHLVDYKVCINGQDGTAARVRVLIETVDDRTSRLGYGRCLSQRD